jgi:hypothetical protein
MRGARKGCCWQEPHETRGKKSDGSASLERRAETEGTTDPVDALVRLAHVGCRSSCSTQAASRTTVSVGLASSCTRLRAFRSCRTSFSRVLLQPIASTMARCPPTRTPPRSRMKESRRTSQALTPLASRPHSRPCPHAWSQPDHHAVAQWLEMRPERCSIQRRPTG